MSIFDLGPFNDQSVDYPDFAKKVSGRIKSGKSDVGILVCGSGTGMAITANKIKGIRAAVCYNLKSTRLSRQHNNANIIALGSRLTKKKHCNQISFYFFANKIWGRQASKKGKKNKLNVHSNKNW